VLLAAIAVWLGGTFFFYTSRERTFAVSRETGVDVISTDAKTGVTVTRDRRTGKIIFMDVNDVAPDEVRPVTPVPSWVPIYPRVESASAGSEGVLVLRTADPVANVVAFYETELGRQGIALARAGSPQKVVLSGARAGTNLTLSVTKDDAGAVLVISTAAR
jgi:hypothetical protein